jgi:hypothetical protein
MATLVQIVGEVLQVLGAVTTGDTTPKELKSDLAGLLWTRLAGTTSGGEAKEIAVDDDGQIKLAGTLDLDPEVGIDVDGDPVAEDNPLPVRASNGTSFIALALDATVQAVVDALAGGLPAALGSQAADDSLGVALSTEDATALGSVAQEAGGNLDAIAASLVTIAARLGPGTHVGSSALEKSHVISNAACTLRSAKVINTGADAWLMVFDAASLPTNGTAPDRTPVLVQASSTDGDTWQGGTALDTGCVLALSSTVDQLTLVASDVAWFDAEIDS